MRIIGLNRQNQKGVARETAAVLKRGGLVVAPSDTVYGLLVRADSANAVKKLIEFKNRPPGKPISIFLRSVEEIAFFSFLSEKNKRLIEEILPGRYTVVLKSRHRVVPSIEAEKGTLGMRVVDNLFINSLLDETNFPFTATSANLSGRRVVYSIDHLLSRIPEKKKKLINLIIDGGKLPRHKPSTVIDLSGEGIKTLRKGNDFLSGKEVKISRTERETKKIAIDLIKVIKNKIVSQAVVLLLRGELGAGKTIFVKGIGETLRTKKIISPTFVIYYHYPVTDKVIKHLYHFDLYRLGEPDELARLGMEKLLQKGTLICVEWGEKTADLISIFKKKAFLIEVGLEYFGEKERLIKISCDQKTNR